MVLQTPLAGPLNLKVYENEGRGVEPDSKVLGWRRVRSLKWCLQSVYYVYIKPKISLP